MHGSAVPLNPGLQAEEPTEAVITFNVVVEADEERTARLTQEAAKKAEADKMQAQAAAAKKEREEKLAAEVRFLMIKVDKAEGLNNVESGLKMVAGVSDPYVDIKYRLANRTIPFSRKTPVVNDELNPVWGFQCTVELNALVMSPGEHEATLEFLVRGAPQHA